MHTSLTGDGGQQAQGLIARVAVMQHRQVLRNRRVRQRAVIRHRQHLLAARAAGVRPPSPRGDGQRIAIQPHDVVVMERVGLRLRRGKLLSAGRANHHANVHQFVAVVAHLHRCFACSASLAFRRLHGGDRAMRLHNAREVEDKAILFTIGNAHPAPSHLDVEARRHCRPQHDNEVNAGSIEAGCQDVGIRKRAKLARAESADQIGALGLAGVPGDAACGNAVLSQHLGNVLRMFDTSAEEQPGAAISGECQHLTHSLHVVQVRIDGGLQFAFDVLPAALVNAGNVEARLCHLGAQRRKVPLKHQFLDGYGFN